MKQRSVIGEGGGGIENKQTRRRSKRYFPLGDKRERFIHLTKRGGMGLRTRGGEEPSKTAAVIEVSRGKSLQLNKIRLGVAAKRREKRGVKETTEGY